MIKKIFLITVLINYIAFAQVVPIKAEIKYNEASAKIEAFTNIERKIPKEIYKDFLKDPNYQENKESLKNKILIIENKRTLCPFYLKNTLISYAVVLDENPLMVYYYNSLGSLIRFDIITETAYPRKTIGYSRYGNILSVAFEVSNEEQFVYHKNGKLLAHWENNEMKNKNNEIPKFLKLKRGLE